MNNLTELVELEIAKDKALAISSDLNDDYFNMGEPEDWFLMTNYNTSALKSRIVFDYLNQIEEITNTLRTLVDDEFKKAKGKIA